MIRACFMVSLLHVFLCTLLAAALVPEPALDAATSCTAMANLSLRDATITLATIVEPGAFTPPGPGSGAQAYRRAVYKGAGSSDDAANFDCRTERD